MMRFVTTLIVLMLLAGGAIAWVLTSSAQAAEEPDAEAVLPDPAFVQVGPLVLPLIQDGRVTHHVELLIVLDINSEHEKFVEAMLPKVFDRILSELHGLLALKFVREAPNPRALLRDRLRLLSWRLLGRAVVNDVLVSDFKKFRPRSG